MSDPTAAPTHGCMDCKAQQPYTVVQFANGNTGWRCVVCGHILRLLPGRYLRAELAAPQPPPPVLPGDLGMQP